MPSRRADLAALVGLICSSDSTTSVSPVLSCSPLILLGLMVLYFVIPRSVPDPQPHQAGHPRALEAARGFVRAPCLVPSLPHLHLADFPFLSSELNKSGKARSIGVSNFRIMDLEKVLAVATVRPLALLS